MRLFPYQPRPCQEEFVSLVEKTVESAGHMVVESGTGTGKTVCSLTGALQASLHLGKRVLYLTRTKSQQRQVIIESRCIAEKETILATGIQGRNSICPLAAREKELSCGNAEELSRYCKEQKRKVMNGEGGCSYYKSCLDIQEDDLLKICRERMPQVEEFVSICLDRNACPYEMMKLVLPYADVVVAPYNYFFMPFIHSRFLYWMNVSPEDLVVIVDEAHNIPDYLRELQTISLNTYHLQMLREELKEFGDPEVMSGISALDVADVLEGIINDASQDYLNGEDGLIPPNLLNDALMLELHSNSVTLEKMYELFCEYGELIRDRRKERGHLPRSYMFIVGRFLQEFNTLDERYYVKVVTGGDYPSLQCYCLDPAPAASPLLECHASIHMSGTLDPITEYRDSLGLGGETLVRYFKSPFPPENCLVLHATDVTTRYEILAHDDGMLKRIESYAIELCNRIHRNTAIFFTSYTMMGQFLKDGLISRVNGPVYIEEKGMAQSELMDTVDRFRHEEGAVLLAVYGGRVSEGLDFPATDLEMAILVGIPYPRPSARSKALLAYYDMKFNKGWEYAVKTPAVRRMRQAMGRVIRSEKDRGVVVILDERAASLPALGSRPSYDPLGEAQIFFSSKT